MVLYIIKFIFHCYAHSSIIKQKSYPLALACEWKWKNKKQKGNKTHGINIHLLSDATKHALNCKNCEKTIRNKELWVWHIMLHIVEGISNLVEGIGGRDKDRTPG